MPQRDETDKRLWYHGRMDAPRFIADKTVGRLAKWLRLLGYDCALQKEDDVERLFAQARDESRVILTKNTRRHTRRGIPTHLVLASSDSMEQLRQVIDTFQLTIGDDRMLTICSVCNTPVEPLTAEQARGLVPPYVFATQREYSRCPNCGRVYWAGTHRAKMLARLQSSSEA